jgi:fido (protein-threonine AMPylation protein)
MTKYSGRDHYLDPVSGVLKNRLGITDAAILEQSEEALVATRSHELSQTPLKVMKLAWGSRQWAHENLQG